ncbi:hypothetical protein [Tepidiforma sp.]|uniref:hypothetical protein n=1 Tax=Tepidiforma sp. TaxID=2682230 RepID=UPI002ADDB69A|nr:hypothetical protein [Tepidiforma sp.]
MGRIGGVELAPNWSSAAGALEGVLRHAGIDLPRHAVMGLTGHAFHFCLGSKAGVVALPSGPASFDRGAMVSRYARTGLRFERFAAVASGETKEAAVAWAVERLDAGVPLIGWDLHLHEFGIIDGYDRWRGGFFVQDILTEEVGPFVAWEAWAPLGEVELWAPVEAVEVAPRVVVEALGTALNLLAGAEGGGDGQPRGTAGLVAWAEALEGSVEVDRAGNAYTLAVLAAARTDGAAFLRDLEAALPEAAAELGLAARALEEEVKALSPLITLFPFPSGGHGNVQVPGLRRAAAMALRRAASYEGACAEALMAALERLEGG